MRKKAAFRLDRRFGRLIVFTGKPFEEVSEMSRKCLHTRNIFRGNPGILHMLIT
jgi:hypothetical protein